MTDRLTEADIAAIERQTITARLYHNIGGNFKAFLAEVRALMAEREGLSNQLAQQSIDLHTAITRAKKAESERIAFAEEAITHELNYLLIEVSQQSLRANNAEAERDDLQHRLDAATHVLFYLAAR